MNPKPKNYYLALALSILVVFAWNYFFAKPKPGAARQTQYIAPF